ncbi:MAG: hypothetical protein HKN58_00255 [Xanthomonadales bacterium]|nr:hypothetical protein [Xanthomonadales bacterium]
MKILSAILIYALAVLSILAGGAKISLMPQELEFLQGFGLNAGLVVAFGIVQVAGGAMLLFSRVRTVGAILVASAFLVSAILVFLTGNWVFGLISLVPAALAGVVIRQAPKT